MIKEKLKGLILGGGKGERLRPFTYTGAKQLVPIANKPVLFYAIEDLVSCGITDIGIVVGDMRAQLEKAVGDGDRFGARVTYIQQEAPLGIAHAVKIAADFLAGHPFVLYLGDTLVLGGVATFVQHFRSDSSNCRLLLCRVENPQSFGVAEMVDGRVARVVEKPRQPASDLAVIGVYMFDGHVFEAVEQLQPSARGELEITDTIQYLIDKGLAVHAQELDRYWMDTGKMDDILQANAVVLDALPARQEGSIDSASQVQGRVIVERGAQVTNSILDGPLIIGEESHIADSQIGPHTSIYHHCQVKGSRIANSVVMEYTLIEDVGYCIQDSLIGRYVELRGEGGVDDRRYALTLGDHSQIRAV
ncbi:MAG: glucose-1-phosphate thymidylyltransferase [Dehalococcoidia bacterium]|nr:glucose-1-phosphate thymidylyltransferase [Dehalococcoidia bacterium]